MHHSLDNTIIANAVQHISSIAWAPDPGGTQIPAAALKAATLMAIQGATTILQCMEVHRALSDFTSGDGMDPAGGGNECPGGAKASGSTPITAQVVESNTKARVASAPSISTVGAGKGLTGGGKWGKMGGNNAGAAGDVSGGRVS